MYVIIGKFGLIASGWRVTNTVGWGVKYGVYCLYTWDLKPG
jgi:hypothetical protein